MAVSITTKASVYSGTNAASYATGSWTPTTGRLAVCVVQSEISGTTNVPTVSGNGITWSEVRNYEDDTSGTTSRITVFVAKTAGSSAGAVTADFASQTQAGGNVIVDEVDGADVSGTALQAIVQSVAGTVNGSGTSESISLAALASAGNASYGAFHHQADEATSNGTGYTSLGGGSHAGPSSALFTEYKAAGSTTVDASWATSSGKGGIAMEIKAAAVAVTSKSLALLGVG